MPTAASLQVWEQVEAMPPEQQKQLRAQALDQLLRRRRVMVDGKVGASTESRTALLC